MTRALVGVRARMRLRLLPGILGAAFLGSACIPPAPKPAVASDASKAETDKDKDKVDFGDGKAFAEPEKPKGPVYAAPFTAEQIQRATRNGRTYRFKVESPDQSPLEYMITFRNVDDSGAEISSSSDDSKRVSWRTLQQQTEFPKDKVVTRPDKVKIPAGRFDCIVYEVTRDDGEVWTYYFAKKLPGAPVFFFVEREGERLRTTTLVDYLPGN